MTERIVFAGFGGQGIMFMGKLLAEAAVAEGKYVTWMPSYGAEVRGGTAHSMVVISDEPIASPVVKNPDTAIVMNKPSFDKFQKTINQGGLFIVNSSLVKDEPERKDIEVIEVDATNAASDLGNIRTANMVALGAYIARKKLISLESVIAALNKALSDKKGLVGINENALKKGQSYGKG